MPTGGDDIFDYGEFQWFTTRPNSSLFIIGHRPPPPFPFVTQASFSLRLLPPCHGFPSASSARWAYAASATKYLMSHYDFLYTLTDTYTHESITFDTGITGREITAGALLSEFSPSIITISA